jgi:hypothetical protein
MIGLLLGGAAFTFKIKQDSEAAIDRVSKLESKIKAEQDAIDVLEADWSLLTDPKRLEALVERYKDQLPLVPTDPKSIATIDEIQPRPVILPEPAIEGIAGLIENDNLLTTGAVEAVSDSAPSDSGATQ